MISNVELNELLNVPKEWRMGDERLSWPVNHDTFNMKWLDTLWKYLAEYNKSDLSMMENLNIIYTTPNTKQTQQQQQQQQNGNTMTLFKLSKSSPLVYTPPYNNEPSSTSTTTTTSQTNCAPSSSSSAAHTTTNGDKTNNDGENINNNNSSSSSSNSETSDDISEETYVALLRVLAKLGFQCVDALPVAIKSHPLFFNYVPNLRVNGQLGLLKALRNKYRHTLGTKLTHEFNTLLADADIRLLQLYLAKLDYAALKELTTTEENSSSGDSLVDLVLNKLPIFENSALDASVRYLTLGEASLVYDTPIRLPFELTGLKPFVYAQAAECKLIDKLALRTVEKDFTHIIRHIVKYCSSPATVNAIGKDKVHALGKWLLLNCSSFILANMNTSNSNSNENKSSSSSAAAANNNNKNSANSNSVAEAIKSAKLFMNQQGELCSPTQLVNPLFRDRFVAIIEPKWIPARDLCADDKCMNMLRELRMRSCLELKVDEIIDMYESSLRQNETHRRLFAELVVDILTNRLHDAEMAAAAAAAVASSAAAAESTTTTTTPTPTPPTSPSVTLDKALNEYSTVKAVTLRHFLMSVSWMPIQRERPQSYPPSLIWKGGESPAATVDLNKSPQSTTTASAAAATSVTRFSSPRECVDAQYGYCAGSVAFVTDLDMCAPLKKYIELKPVHLDVVVRHLKLTTKCFESSALKAEWYDYLTVAKCCYEFMNAYQPADIYRELKANDLHEWIWNGAGFSNINAIFMITDKEHPLCSHAAILPYELYVMVRFFEQLGIKKQPSAKQMEHMLLACVRNTQKLMKSIADTTTTTTANNSPLKKNQLWVITNI